MSTALLALFAICIVSLFMIDFWRRIMTHPVYHYLPEETPTQDGRFLTACGVWAYMSEASLAPDCEACEEAVRLMSRRQRDQQLATWTHYVAFGVSQMHTGQARAICGHLANRDRQSMDPTCPECKAALARENDESIEDRFGEVG